MPLDFDKCKLQIIEPAFGSNLNSTLFRLEQLRSKQMYGEIHPYIFFQIKEIFHLLESIGSARIEGNRTTVSEYIDTSISKQSSDRKKESFLEIGNMERALTYIDQNLNVRDAISKTLILELHRMVVDGLRPPSSSSEGEGDKTPGKFREHNVQIRKSQHIPPESVHVSALMEELISFINEKHSQQYDLLKTAIAHHRFAWIHPFGNGNGRVVRLLTYAMLVRQGFDVKTAGRIINPTAVFCNDRDRYCDMLARADSYEDSALLAWCEYVLGGLELEVRKIDRLLDLVYTAQKIIMPAIAYCEERQRITKKEASYLRIMAPRIDKEVQSKDFEKLESSIINRSRFIRHLKAQKLIASKTSKSRRYVLRLSKGPLTYGVMHALSEEGFLKGLEDQIN